LRNPRDLVPGSVMPPFPWIVNDETEFKSLVAYLQTLGRAKNWRPDNDYER
jgi:cytochrome c oxidase cbb3-type subunit II